MESLQELVFLLNVHQAASYGMTIAFGSHAPGLKECDGFRAKGGSMETPNSGKRIICKGIDLEGPVSEQKIWAAVLLQAVEDWRSENAKLHRDAAQFLFKEENDFEVVCAGAGIEPSSFRSRLAQALNAENKAPESTSRIAA